MTFEVRSDGPIVIPEDMLPQLKRYRSQAKTLRVSITPVFKDRTMSQNAFFHAKVNEIARNTGVNREHIKDEIKKFAISMGYPCEEEEDGTLKLKDDEPIPISSAKASIESMTILIEALYLWCNENGIQVEDYI